MKYSSLFKEVLLVLLRTIPGAVYNIDYRNTIEDHMVDFDAETCAVHLTFKPGSMWVELLDREPDSIPLTAIIPIDEQSTCEELFTFIALAFDMSPYNLEWLVELWDQDAVVTSGVLSQIPCPN